MRIKYRKDGILRCHDRSCHFATVPNESATLKAMNLEDPQTLALFLEVYGTLPRAGPGSTEDTLRALALVPTPNVRRILDLGCGPGAQTLVLADACPNASILALDILPTMVAETRRRLAEAGHERRVEATVGDLLAPKVADRSQDIIWCEGAIYNAGITNALRRWRPLIADDGSVAFTEPVWLHSNPPAAVAAWWRREYPAITDEAGVRRQIAAAGFATVATFALPPESWWNEYYEPMTARIDELRASHPEDPIAEEIAVEAANEIETFRSHSQDYGSAFFIVRPR
jgi:trans-aconitate methyltransferase